MNNVLRTVLEGKIGLPSHVNSNLQLDHGGKALMGATGAIHPGFVVCESGGQRFLVGRRLVLVVVSVKDISDALVELIPRICFGEELIAKRRATMNLQMYLLVEGIHVDVGRAIVALRFRVREPGSISALHARIVKTEVRLERKKQETTEKVSLVRSRKASLKSREH